MKSDFKSYFDVKIGSDKNFGLVFAVFFLLTACYPLLYGEVVRLWAMFISLVLVLVSYFAPKIFSLPKKLWFKLGIAIGAVISPIVLTFIYVMTILPVGLIMRLLRKDQLRLQFDNEAETYWINRTTPLGSMKDQF